MFIITIIVKIFQCTITLIQSFYVKSRSGCIIHLYLYVFISDLFLVSRFFTSCGQCFVVSKELIALNVEQRLERQAMSILISFQEIHRVKTT